MYDVWKILKYQKTIKKLHSKIEWMYSVLRNVFLIIMLILVGNYMRIFAQQVLLLNWIVVFESKQKFNIVNYPSYSKLQVTFIFQLTLQVNHSSEKFIFKMEIKFDNEVFRVYAISISVLIAKVLLMAFMTARQRFANKVSHHTFCTYLHFYSI